MKKKLRNRRCLYCGQPFQTFGPNRICKNCHEKHQKLFSSALPPQWETLIYNIPVSIGDDLTGEDIEGDGEF